MNDIHAMTSLAQAEWERAEKERLRAEYERERADLAEAEAMALWGEIQGPTGQPS